MKGFKSLRSVNLDIHIDALTSEWCHYITAVEMDRHDGWRQWTATCARSQSASSKFHWYWNDQYESQCCQALILHVIRVLVLYVHFVTYWYTVRYTRQRHSSSNK